MEAESDSDCVQVEHVKVASLTSLPNKSRSRYETAYRWFMDWKEENKRTSLSEEVLLAYFVEISKKLKPTSLWALFSMLKLTLNINNGVNIDGYVRLKDFLKAKARDYTPKEMKTLTKNQIEQFIQEAPDAEFLCVKVALIFAVVGGCRKRELYQMTTSHLEDFGTAVLITIPSANSKAPRKFIVNGKYYNVFKKYANLRPPNVKDPNFFLSYIKGKCAVHKMGVNKFGLLGKQVAKYLKLPNAALYKGYLFRLRRSSSMFLGIGEDTNEVKIPSSKPAAIADEFTTNQLSTVNDILAVVNNTNVVASTSQLDRDENERFQILSTSIPLSENETNDPISEDPLADDIYQDVDEDDESEVDDKNFIACDVTDTEVLQNEVEPLSVHLNSEGANPKQCDLFGEYISKHLQRLPVEMALRLQSGIQALVLQARLEYIREHPNEAPAMVKEENPNTNSREEPINNNEDNRFQNGTEKRPQNTGHQQPAVKRFKSNTSSSETKKSKQKTNERTEFAVFGEHIALQLEQLPEDVSLQLQTEIYDLITQTFLKHTVDDMPNRVKIKDEFLEMDATELLDL